MRYLELTAPHFERIITVQPQNPRSLSAEALADEAKHFCKDVQFAQSMKDAIESDRFRRRSARHLRFILLSI